MYADSDVSLHSAYIYDFSTYTYREREREFLQWLCVRMYVCASSTMNRRRLKENPSSVMGSESSRLVSVSSIRNASYSMIITIIMRTFFLDGRGVGLVWGKWYCNFSLIYTYYKPTSSKLRKSKSKHKTLRRWGAKNSTLPSSSTRDKPNAINLVRIPWCVTCVIRRRKTDPIRKKRKWRWQTGEMRWLDPVKHTQKKEKIARSEEKDPDLTYTTHIASSMKCERSEEWWWVCDFLYKCGHVIFRCRCIAHRVKKRKVGMSDVLEM